MSELNFSIMDNNADFQQKTKQLREAIAGLETDFINLYTSAGSSIKGIEQFINELRAQIDDIILTLDKIDLDNKIHLGSLQPSLLIDTNSSQGVAMQSEVSEREVLLQSIKSQQNGLRDLKVELSEYEQKLKQVADSQMTFASGLEAMKTELQGTSGIFSVAAGAMELFGIKSEFLQTAQEKVQAALAITNGLQEISTALSKNSAFQLNVLGKIKMWWKSITLQTAAAQGVETVAASTGTVANLGLAGSFRAIGMAIKSIPIFGWIAVGISALIGVSSIWSSSTKQQKNEQRELNKEMDNFNDKVQGFAAQPIANIEILSNKFKALGDNIEAQNKFITDNKSAFDELGLSITSVKDAQQLLIDNKDKFIKAQIAKATSLAYMDLVREDIKLVVGAQMESDARQNEIDKKLRNVVNKKKPMLGDSINGTVTQRDDFTLGRDNFDIRKSGMIESNGMNSGNSFSEREKEVKARIDYNMAQGISQLGIADQLMSGFKTKPNKLNTKSEIDELQKQLDSMYESQAIEYERQVKDLASKNRQAEIEAMPEGLDKKIAQMRFNHKQELKELDVEEKELLEQRRKTAENIFNTNEELEMKRDSKHKKQTFDPSSIQLSESEKVGFEKRKSNIISRQNNEIQARIDADNQALNEQLAAYGDYEQKREAIIKLGEAKKKGKSEGEQETINKETNNSLVELEKEVNKKTSAFEKLFSNMKNKSITEIRDIVTLAKDELAFVENEEWDSTKGKKFGIGEKTFNELRNSPEAIQDIKDNIKELEDQTNQCDTAFNKMSIGFGKLFESGSDPKKLNEALSLIESGLNETMQAGQFLSNSLSSLGDAFGSEALGGAAEGINVAMDAASSAMSGAKAGAMFGPWGAAAGAAIGLVSSLGSSLAKLHDAKHEKSIQKIQDQIEVLEKSYGNLGESLEKAYSADASKLIDQQNTLLAQQKVLIQNQIAEEQSKKKSDKGRIEEWQNQIEEIDKQIAGNKEKQIDAIMGSDVKSAIDDFAQAYADAWAAGDDRAKSSKDLVKQMIKQMVMEAIKATTSQPMEALRQKLAGFFSDGVISAWEREQIEKGAADLTKQLDEQFGWADEYLQGDKEGATSQDSSRGGFESMSQETGSELNGRFTALQISNEEIKNSMLLALGNMSALCTTTSDGNILLSEMRNLAIMSNGHLEDIARYTKPILGFGEKLDKIERNTANL